MTLESILESELEGLTQCWICRRTVAQVNHIKHVAIREYNKKNDAEVDYEEYEDWHYDPNSVIGKQICTICYDLLLSLSYTVFDEPMFSEALEVALKDNIVIECSLKKECGGDA